MALGFDPLRSTSGRQPRARLRVSLRDRGLRMPVNDSWIAATAMAPHISMVTQDEDYVDVPGLEVIRA